MLIENQRPQNWSKDAHNSIVFSTSFISTWCFWKDVALWRRKIYQMLWSRINFYLIYSHTCWLLICFKNDVHYSPSVWFTLSSRVAFHLGKFINFFIFVYFKCQMFWFQFNNTTRQMISQRALRKISKMKSLKRLEYIFNMNHLLVITIIYYI